MPPVYRAPEKIPLLLLSSSFFFFNWTWGLCSCSTLSSPSAEPIRSKDWKLELLGMLERWLRQRPRKSKKDQKYRRCRCLIRSSINKKERGRKKLALRVRRSKTGRQILNFQKTTIEPLPPPSCLSIETNQRKSSFQLEKIWIFIVVSTAVSFWDCTFFFSSLSYLYIISIQWMI